MTAIKETIKEKRKMKNKQQNVYVGKSERKDQNNIKNHAQKEV